MKIYVDNIPSEGLEIREDIDHKKILPDLDAVSVSFVRPIDVKAKVVKAERDVFIDVVLEADCEYTCARCLAKFQKVFKKNFNMSYEVSPGDILEIDEDIRQEIVVDYPMKILCEPDCKGLCPNCGQNLNVEKCDCNTKK